MERDIYSKFFMGIILMISKHYRVVERDTCDLNVKIDHYKIFWHSL